MSNPIQHGTMTPADIDPTDVVGRGNHVIQGLNAVVDEAARNAIVQVATDRGRVIEQTAGATPGFYIARGITGQFVRISEEIRQEMHKVVAGEVAAGYFTLLHNQVNAQSVSVSVVAGIRQINKQVVGTTGAIPDFDVLSTNQIHINNSGGASGLSGDIIADDILIIDYHS